MNTANRTPAPGPPAARPDIRQLTGMLQQCLRSLTRALGGAWTLDSGAPFTEHLDPGQFPAIPCTPAGQTPRPSDGRQVTLTLRGPGAPVPEALLSAVLDWADVNGWTEVERGQGTDPVHGGRFVTVDGPGRPLISVDASTRGTLVTSRSPGSTHPTVLAHVRDRATVPTAPTRFPALVPDVPFRFPSSPTGPEAPRD